MIEANNAFRNLTEKTQHLVKSKIMRHLQRKGIQHTVSPHPISSLPIFACQFDFATPLLTPTLHYTTLYPLQSPSSKSQPPPRTNCRLLTPKTPSFDATPQSCASNAPITATLRTNELITVVHFSPTTLQTQLSLLLPKQPLRSLSRCSKRLLVTTKQHQQQQQQQFYYIPLPATP